MSEDNSLESRHHDRMKRKKEVVDEKIATAKVDRGVFIINTGIGKGKSSSGFGMVARALGHGMKVGVVQFVKGRSDTGEAAFFSRFPEEVSIHVMGEGFTWETQDRERDVVAAKAAWEQARKMLTDDKIDLILLDELAIALKHRYLDVETVLNDVKARPFMQHVVITGRGAPQELIDAADTVTEMSLVKHAFTAGVKAQRGIEW